MLRRAGALTNLGLFVVLVCAASWLMWWQNNRLDAGAVATLVGALFGAAALLLGNLINSVDERARAREVLEARRAKVKTLISTELINVAVDLFNVKDSLDARMQQAAQGVLITALRVDVGLPRGIPLSVALGAELLILQQAELDSLITLQANLEVTRQELQKASNQIAALTQTRVQGLIAGAKEDMELLAECFEAIAPQREMRLETKGQKRTSVLLREAVTE